MTLLQFLLDRIAAAGLSADDISRVIVPIDDPRVADGELSVTPAEFAALANQVDLADARTDILIGIQPPAVDEQGVPIIPPPEEVVVGWVENDFRIVRGPGAISYTLTPDDLRRSTP